MNKQIFVINGSGGVGKDTFVELVSVELNDKLKRFHTVVNFSSVDKVKEIAREIGWDGRKTEKDRKFLSDLKSLTIYNVIDYCSQTQAVYDHLWNCSYPINELLHSFLDLFTGVKKYVVYY